MTLEKQVILGKKTQECKLHTLIFCRYLQFILCYFKINGMCEFLSFSNSNDDMEEGDPGSDSDFEIDTKKEVSNTRHSGF